MEEFKGYLRGWSPQKFKVVVLNFSSKHTVFPLYCVPPPLRVAVAVKVVVVMLEVEKLQLGLGLGLETY